MRKLILWIAAFVACTYAGSWIINYMVCNKYNYWWSVPTLYFIIIGWGLIGLRIIDNEGWDNKK